jgi:hypothetical protein
MLGMDIVALLLGYTSAAIKPCASPISSFRRREGERWREA